MTDEVLPVNPLRWMCQSCDWAGIDGEVLRAPNPFDPSGVIGGCPKCKAVDDFVPGCDALGCDMVATCGYPSPDGYRRTCERHYVDKPAR